MSPPDARSTAETATANGIDAARKLVAEDLRALDDTIREQLRSDVVLINQVGDYIIGAGGKRLRPLLVLLSAHACGYRGAHHVTTAAIIEFIHTATLLHDDVVDESDRRRGRDTANHRWGNAASVLVGDFLYSRSFQMMVSVDSMRVMQILADTTNTIAEGEVMQLMHTNDPDTDEARYLEVIDCKTARLFQAATQLGAVLAGRPEPEIEAMGAYGQRLGLAFQIADDVLDYSADGKVLGKNLGDDLAEGKSTLPLIHAMQRANDDERALLRRAVEHGDRGRLAEVLEIIRATGGLDYARERAQEEARAAIAALDDVPGSEYRDAMTGLADYAVDRAF